MRQDGRASFDRALHRARVLAYAPGEFVGQESFMTAGEIRALAVRAGIGPEVTVLDLCCGVGGPGRFLTRELGCEYLGVDASASAVALARERAGDLPCGFAAAHVPPLPAGSFDVVLLLETMLAFEGKDALVRKVAAALRPGGRLAFTLEEGPPLTAAERAAMPGADTVWLTPLDEMVASLEQAGLVVTCREDHSHAHRATAQALADAFAADAEDIAAQIGRRSLEELLTAHRLWVEWLDEGRIRKLALVAERALTAELPYPQGPRRAPSLPSEQEASMLEDETPRERDPHHALNEPASDPDPTEWPDPYDKRPDPRGPEADPDEPDSGDVHTPTGATSTSAPSHETDLEVDPRKANPHESDKRG